jgi:8-hydroxy-5-deazaflavin:NADPH oxidoreductase
MTVGGLRIALIGGTGDLGSGLAFQFAKAGFDVFIGSRSTDRAETTASELRDELPAASITAADNASAAVAADVVMMTVPYASHDATLESIREQVQGKIFVDTTVPLVPPKVMRVQLPQEGSVAKRAQQMLGEDVRVVSAFQNIAAVHLRNDQLSEVACDVLVCGNHPAARDSIIGIAEKIGLKAWHAGPIDNSVVAEALTSVLIFMNKRYGMDGAGIRIVGRSARE